MVGLVRVTITSTSTGPGRRSWLVRALRTISATAGTHSNGISGLRLVVCVVKPMPRCRGFRQHSYLRSGASIVDLPSVYAAGTRMTLYRFHLDDPVPFRDGLQVSIERRAWVYTEDPETGKTRTEGDMIYRPDHYSSVAIFYHEGVFAPAGELADFW